MKILPDSTLQIIQFYAKRYGLSPKLIEAIIMVESSGDPFAFRWEKKYRWIYRIIDFITISRHEQVESFFQKSSFGLMQIMGATARELGFKKQLHYLFDPENSIKYGCIYLYRQKKRYKDHQLDMIASYNGGHAAKGSNGLYRNQTYVDKVLKAYSTL